MCVEEIIILAPEILTEIHREFKLGTITWDGSAPTEERWEGDNPSLGHAKCTLIT
jgi:hypothetical protein